MKRRILWLLAAATLAALLPAVAAGATGGGGYPSNGIIGTITDGDGNPIEYIGVRGFKLVGDTWQETYFSWTGANGVYEMPVWGAAVTVKLYFFQKHVSEEEATWRPEWYNDAPTMEAATPIVVPAGVWMTANAVMSGPGSIVGRVTDAATGNPIAGITVRAHLAADGRTARPGGGETSGHITDANGYYELAPLRAGKWILEFRDPQKQWADQWSGGGMIEDEAVPVEVVEGVATAFDAGLVPGGGVAVYPVVVESGRVLDDKTEDPGIGEVCLDAFNAAGNRVAGRQDAWDWIFVLPSGEYFFRFSDCVAPVEYATAWYPGVAEFDDAVAIAVVAGRWNGTFFISTAGQCAGEWPTIIGTSGDDMLRGTAGRDVISAGLGADVVYGLGGNDLMCLGEGNDIAVGGPGADWVYGDAGNDRLRGSYHADRLLGGAGNDRLFGGGAGDVLIGGPGTDALDGGTGPNVCRLGETLIDC